MTEKALKPIKPFLNYEEQIRNLIERKGMIITDREVATSKLEDISYFALIDGYKNLFYNPMTRKYREGTTFEDIVALYEFDEKLRALIFQYLCHFEQKMRSLISYHFCDTYSERQVRAARGLSGYCTLLMWTVIEADAYGTESCYGLSERNFPTSASRFSPSFRPSWYTRSSSSG